MALKQNFTTDTGLECQGAYIKVEQLSLNKDGMSAKVIWKKDETYENEFHKDIFFIPYDINGDNPFKQTYEYLKTLEEFKDAEDC